MADEGLRERQLSSTLLFQGHFLTALRDEVALPDGQHTVREYIRHPGAVMVIPMLHTARGLELVLERQYRYPVGQVMLEFPAGKRDGGEDALACAQRELREETGYRASQWARAGVVHPVIAYSTECIEIWFAQGLVAGERALDQGEFLDVFTATLDDLLQWSAQGLVTDAKTLSGLLWLQNVQAGTWRLDWQTVA